MSGGVAKLTRAELYEQVWTTPMRRLAPQYGLSDVGLAKICKKLNIPRPPVGYWAKKEVGKAPARPKLPDADEHGDDLVELPIPGEIEEPQQYEFHDAKLAELYENELRRSALKTPAAVRSGHRIAHQSKCWFTEHAQWEARCKKAGAGMYWPEPPKRPCDTLSLDVSHEILDRVVRFIAGIEKAASNRGYRCRVFSDDARHLEIEALGTRFYLRVREKLRQVKHELTDDERREIKRYGRVLLGPPKWDLEPKGELELFFGRSASSWQQRTWRDTARIKLEDRLHDIFLWIIFDADCQRAEHARREEAARRAAEAERRRREEEERRRQEQSRRDRLLEDVEAWHRANRVREFVRLIESEARSMFGEFPPDSEMEQWIAWAMEVADDHDPLRAYLHRDNADRRNQSCSPIGQSSEHLHPC